MRKKIIAGNWKMNKNLAEAKELFLGINRFCITHTHQCDIVVAPPFVFIEKASEIFTRQHVKLAAQNMSQYTKGAYTGEISAEMLKSINTEYVILGHSERRQYFGETDPIISEKVKQALSQGLIPIYCNGETLEERKKGIYKEVIKKQTETALFQLSTDEIKNIVIAYEPVWAIGTGETASPEQAQEVHQYIRSIIANKYGENIAQEISILYGGSVKPSNATDIFKQADVDGGLIGGASLVLEDFIALINSLDKSM